MMDQQLQMEQTKATEEAKAATGQALEQAKAQAEMMKSEAKFCLLYTSPSPRDS